MVARSSMYTTKLRTTEPTPERHENNAFVVVFLLLTLVMFGGRCFQFERFLFSTITFNSSRKLFLRKRDFRKIDRLTIDPYHIYATHTTYNTHNTYTHVRLE